MKSLPRPLCVSVAYLYSYGSVYLYLYTLHTESMLYGNAFAVYLFSSVYTTDEKKEEREAGECAPSRRKRSPVIL